MKGQLAQRTLTRLIHFLSWEALTLLGSAERGGVLFPFFLKLQIYTLWQGSVCHTKEFTEKQKPYTQAPAVFIAACEDDNSGRGPFYGN